MSSGAGNEVSFRKHDVISVIIRAGSGVPIEPNDLFSIFLRNLFPRPYFIFAMFSVTYDSESEIILHTREPRNEVFIAIRGANFRWLGVWASR